MNCYLTHEPWTNKELSSFLKACNTSFTITKENGKERVLYHTCAILDNNAKPIPIEDFKIRSGQRVMRTISEKVAKSFTEKFDLKESKKVWKKEHPNHKSIVIKDTAEPFKQIYQAIEMSKSINNN